MNGLETPGAALRRHTQLVDVAAVGTATQSTISTGSIATGPGAAVRGDFSRDFTIHTAPGDEHPWWQLDLRAWYRVSLIVVRNRRDPKFWSRANTLRVSVSEDGQSWVLLHAGFTLFGADDDNALRLPLGGSLPFRYLRISLDRAEPLHLNRVEVLVPAEQVEERQLMESIGIGFEAVSRFSHGGLKPETYRVVGGEYAKASSVDGIRIIRSGRFANNVYQLAMAIEVAQRSGLGFVQMFDSPFFDFGRKVSSERPQILPHDFEIPNEAVVVEGDFFDSTRIQRALGRKGLYSRETAQSARQYLTPYLNLPTAENPPKPDELLVHVRSGDLFGPNPHPRYGQPPLSFYIWAIEQASKLGFGRVRIIAEDRVNPVVDELERYLSSTALPFAIQANGDLEADLATLMSGRGLVFGVGTFGHAICMLSTQAELVFEASRTGAYRTGFPHLTVYSAEPARHDYTPFLEWRGTEEQIREMVDYPVSGFEFVESPKRDGS